MAPRLESCCVALDVNGGIRILPLIFSNQKVIIVYLLDIFIQPARDIFHSTSISIIKVKEKSMGRRVKVLFHFAHL